ncbi:MAG: DUF547 domain-containing protein [Desulfobacteraceae bacterium]|jgi:hypothetical protein
MQFNQLKKWIVGDVPAGQNRSPIFEKQVAQRVKRDTMGHRMRLNTALMFLYFVSVLGLPSMTWANPMVNHAIYTELLKKYVINGKVDYAGFKSEEASLDRYLKLLEAVDSKSLSRDEQFAFYVNAYNAWTIKLILSRYPDVKSIKNLGSLFKSPWKKEIVRLDGEVMTLDNIEHDILRPRFNDPRVHFAINCAAISCPPLSSVPYRADILNDQLNESTRSFLNNPGSYKLDGNDLYVSRIFKWFAEDFNYDVLGFYLNYANDELKQKLEAKRTTLRIKYLHYDWGLNAK